MGAEADRTRLSGLPMGAFIPPELHGVLAHEVRHEILMRAAERPHSATELAEAMGLTRRQVTDQIEELKKTEPPLIELVGKKAGPKGGTMHMYRATRYALDAEQWRSLSPLEQEVSSSTIVRLLTEELGRALRDQTLYALPDHVLYRDRLMVDDRGMANICRILTRAAEEVADEAADAVDRLADSNQRPIPITLGLLSFEVAPKRPECGPKKSGS